MTSEAELIRAAKAVVERWDTPLWKDGLATAGYINALRSALAATPPAQGEAVACQACGGRIEGWTCQVCARVFLENDAGALVMDTAPPPVMPEGVREAATRLAEIAAAVEFAPGDGVAFREAGAVKLAADIRTTIAALTPAGGEG